MVKIEKCNDKGDKSGREQTVFGLDDKKSLLSAKYLAKPLFKIITKNKISTPVSMLMEFRFH